MKLKHVFLLLSFSLILFGKNHLLGQEQHAFQHADSANEINLSQHTLLMLEKSYSEIEIQEMKEIDPEKLLFLDYFYSASFQIKEGQNYSNNQILLIDVSIYTQLRSQTEKIEVLDEESGLYILLDSIETASKQVGAPYHIRNATATGKIAH